jgi:hypothetical protein
MYITIMCFVLLLLTPMIVGVSVFRFANEGTAEIIARTLTATPPRYPTIRELDRKIREFPLPLQAVEAMRGGPGVDPRSVPLPASMLSYLLSNVQDVSESTFPPDTTAVGAKAGH